MPARLPLASALALFAAALPAAASAAGLPQLWRCGERTVETTTTDRGLVLLAGFERVALDAVPAASGARYEKPGDPGTRFHGKGPRALVSLAGETLPECTAEPFRARGNEPFWSLLLAEDELRLERLGQAPRVVAPPPTARIEAGLHTLEARLDGTALLLRIEAVPCIDTMTGMPYPATVRLELGGERLSGCGGDPGSLLRAAARTVRALDGDALPAHRPLELLFSTDGRFAGQAPCNRIMGSYRLSGEELRLGPVASTMMMCEDALMTAERRYVEALEAVRRFELAPGDGVVLVGEGGGRIALDR